MKKQYEKAVQRYIDAFCDKQILQFDGWVSDDVGEVCSMSDFFFNFSDIRRDIDSKAPIGKIIEWYDFALCNESSINYKTWLMANK